MVYITLITISLTFSTISVISRRRRQKWISHILQMWGLEPRSSDWGVNFLTTRLPYCRLNPKPWSHGRESHSITHSQMSGALPANTQGVNIQLIQLRTQFYEHYRVKTYPWIYVQIVRRLMSFSIPNNQYCLTPTMFCPFPKPPYYFH